MTDPTPPDSSLQQPDAAASTAPTPLRCLTGALISGGLAVLLYRLTAAIASTYAAKPIATSNPFAANIASAVRTLVMGMTALATGIFAFATLGLLALAGQLLIQRFRKPQP
jgi:hypothetical protein